MHWDGKLIPDLSGIGTVDRLTVLVTGGAESHASQLLAVPKLPSGKGEAQAQLSFCSERLEFRERV